MVLGAHLLDTGKDVLEQIIEGLARLRLGEGGEGAGHQQEVDEGAAQPTVELGLLSIQLLRSQGAHS